MSNPWDNWRPDVDGWSSDILPFYERMAEEMPDGSSFVEVGVFKGRSLLYLAEALERRGKLLCTITGIDLFTASWDTGYGAEFDRHVAASGKAVCEMVTKLVGTSAQWAPHVVHPDLVFIDADHNYESVRDDIAAWMPHITPTTIMCGHDYDGHLYGSFPGVTRAVNEAFAGRKIEQPSGTVWMVRP